MQIKQKLMLSTGLLIVSLVLMVSLNNYSINTFKELIEGVKVADNMDKLVLQLRRNEKDFLARKQEKYLGKFSGNLKKLQTDSTSLTTIFNDHQLPTGDIELFQKIIKQYHAHFNTLGQIQRKIGYDEKSGLRGTLRESANKLEQSISSANPGLLNQVLHLRRAEKDFFLRKDTVYIDKAKTILTQLGNHPSSDMDQQALATYANSFNAITKAYIDFGLSSKEGVLGLMRKTVHQTEQSLEKIMAINEQEIIDKTTSVTTLMLSIFVVILVASVAGSVVMSRSILNPISELRLLMVKIGSSKNLTLRAAVNNNDEIGQMSTHFNEMVEQFQTLILEVEQSVLTLNGATENLAKNVSITTSGVQSQMVETDMVATAVTEMVATIDEIAHNTSDTASKAELTNNNAMVGQEGVDKTIYQINELSTNLRNSESQLNELETDSQTIGSVVDVIRGIADQTNLLALNAAIEAARAGEQGRGFAVVADEVRSLASKTQESTQEIETIIGQFQSRTVEIVGLMSQCREQGKVSAEQAASTGEMLVEITQDVSTILNMTTSVAAAIEEQSAVASEVNKHIVSIRDVTEQTSDSSDQNSNMSEEVSRQASVLSNSIAQFNVR